VVLVGNGPSAHILRDISSVAKEVHQALHGSDVHFKKLENHNNIWLHSVIVFFLLENAMSFDIRNFKIDEQMGSNFCR
jgi:hypothetical protein